MKALRTLLYRLGVKVLRTTEFVQVRVFGGCRCRAGLAECSDRRCVPPKEARRRELCSKAASRWPLPFEPADLRLPQLLLLCRARRAVGRWPGRLGRTQKSTSCRCRGRRPRRTLPSERIALQALPVSLSKRSAGWKSMKGLKSSL